jgi:2-methylfumaryl-CoA hydratase
MAIAAINGGQHLAPTYAGDTLYAFTEVLDKWKLPGRQDVGALRLRLVGVKNTPLSQVVSSPDAAEGGQRHPAIVLDLDYTALVPRRSGRSA